MKPLRWYKGNLHCHTINSDGDSTPAEVAAWYRRHRYEFLVLSDHNYLTEVATLNKTVGGRDQFLLIPGEEVTDSFEKKQIHINAYGLQSQVEAQHGRTVLDVIQRNVAAIQAAGGLASLNHPNYTWAVTSAELKAVRGLPLFEVHNGSTAVGNKGGGGYESNEEMWDAVLSAGRLLYGVAVDDAHEFQSYGLPLPYPTPPGTGWVSVQASELSQQAILESIQAGRFYATTGAQIESVDVSQEKYTVRMKAVGEERYRTYFIGAGGKVLARSDEMIATYAPKPGDGYVRARVESSHGGIAWTQPVLLPR